MPKKPRSLEEETAFWYAKLKKEGFDDIEYGDWMRNGVSKSLLRSPEVVRSATQEYYYAANHFLHNYKFANRRDQVVWEYHTNGVSVRNISKLLKKVRITISSAHIWRTIKRLQHVMKTDFSWRTDYDPPENLQ
jgi:hypothetical protein